MERCIQIEMPKEHQLVQLPAGCLPSPGARSVSVGVCKWSQPSPDPDAPGLPRLRIQTFGARQSL